VAAVVGAGQSEVAQRGEMTLDAIEQKKRWSIAVIGEPGTNPTEAQLESGGSAYVCPDPAAPYSLSLTIRA
jgi:hypothetical protein